MVLRSRATGLARARLAKRRDPLSHLGTDARSGGDRVSAPRCLSRARARSDRRERLALWVRRSGGGSARAAELSADSNGFRWRASREPPLGARRDARDARSECADPHPAEVLAVA